MVSTMVLFGIPMLQQAFAQSSGDDLWYFGKGLKPDTYFKYQIYNVSRDIDEPSYKCTNCIPATFDMVIYFASQDNNTGFWAGQVFVIANGTVINGTYQEDLSRKNFAFIFGNPAMKPYYYEYWYTIEHLSDFAREPGSPLNAHAWYIDPEHVIALDGIRNITVPAGMFNCTKVIQGLPQYTTWINKDLPYPVKGPGYELEEIGQGYPAKEFPKNISSLLSPLSQFKSGIPTSSVVCNAGLYLVIKSEDGSPACVKLDTAQTLIERGWGHFP